MVTGMTFSNRDDITIFFLQNHRKHLNSIKLNLVNVLWIE